LVANATRMSLTAATSRLQPSGWRKPATAGLTPSPDLFHVPGWFVCGHLPEPKVPRCKPRPAGRGRPGLNRGEEVVQDGPVTAGLLAKARWALPSNMTHREPAIFSYSTCICRGA
jgi:hypothetical protein